MPFSRAERTREWSKVSDLEGEAYFVPTAEVVTNMRCVVVKTNIAALHGSPGNSAPATDFKTVDRFTPLKKVANVGVWIQVQDEAGHLSWINDSQVWKAR